MIQKIKTLLQIQKELDEVNNRYEKHGQTIAGMEKEMKELHSQIVSARQEQEKIAEENKKIVENLNSNVSEINQIHQMFKEELEKFFVIKKDLTREILVRFENELKEQLVKNSDELKLNADNYKKIKSEIEKSSESLKILNTEASKLKEISGKIQKKDFELKNFAKELADADKHKLELMAKIDNLERLVAKMRRRN